MDDKAKRKKKFEKEMWLAFLFEQTLGYPKIYSTGPRVKFLNLEYCGFDILREHEIIL